MFLLVSRHESVHLDVFSLGNLFKVSSKPGKASMMTVHMVYIRGPRLNRRREINIVDATRLSPSTLRFIDPT